MGVGVDIGMGVSMNVYVGVDMGEEFNVSVYVDVYMRRVCGCGCTYP